MNWSFSYRLLARRFLGLLLIAPALLASATQATPRTMRFEHLSIADGLSQSTVNCILQDRVGFLWFGTQDGLNRYDGYEIEIFRHDPEDPISIGHHWIMAMVETESGDLWIGTEGGGLSRRPPTGRGFLNYRHDPDDPQSLSGDHIVSLIASRDDGLWIGTLQSGLSFFHEDAGGKFRRFRHDPDDPLSLSSDQVNALLEDRDGDLWIGTSAGLDRLRAGESSIERVDGIDLSVGQLLQDREGRIWIGTVAGLYRFDPDGRRTAFLPGNPEGLRHPRIRSLLQDRAGRVWVGTEGGLHLVRDSERPDGERFDVYVHDPARPESLAGDQIIDLYQDRGGVLWFSAVGHGVSRWDPSAWLFQNHAAESDGEGPANRNVFAVAEDSAGLLWTGSFGGGLEALDRKTGDRKRFSHDPNRSDSLADDRVTALLSDRDEQLWIGTVGGGLHRLLPDQRGFQRYRHDPQQSDSLSADSVTALLETRAGNLWIGTYGGGLNRMRTTDRTQATDRFDRFQHRPGDPASLAGDRVFALDEDAAGFLWAATDGGGLNRFDPGSETFTVLRHDPADPSSLPGNELTALHVDQKNRLWLAVKGRGLSRLDRLDDLPRASFTVYSRVEGLSNATIWGILSDEDGALWISTHGGLVRYEPDTASSTVFQTQHGLSSNEFNMGAHYAGPSGELFFGGIRGVDSFFPNQIVGRRYEAPVVLTAFQKVNQDAEVPGRLTDLTEIALDHRDYFFSLEFAVLDFAAPTTNRYRYILEGLDEEWIENGSRRWASFTNLNSGDYTLRVQGAGSDGFWNRGPTVKISVTPPPWRTWWAYLLYAAGLIVFLGAVAFVRDQRRQVRRQREIAEAEREHGRRQKRLITERDGLIQKLGEKNAELERFNYTVSHDLKNPLVTIRGFVELIEIDLQKDRTDRARRDLRRINAAADRMQGLIDELLRLSMLGNQSPTSEPIDLRELVSEVVELLQGAIRAKSAVVEVEPNLPTVLGERVRIAEVFQNLLANALKYTDAQTSPRILVGSQHRQGEALIFVRDNGLGITEENLQKIFGLFVRLDSQEEGTGVGLALVARILELHGGKIWAESAGPGQGSTFFFTLPVAPALTEPDPAHDRDGQNVSEREASDTPDAPLQ